MTMVTRYGVPNDMRYKSSCKARALKFYTKQYKLQFITIAPLKNTRQNYNCNF